MKKVDRRRGKAGMRSKQAPEKMTTAYKKTFEKCQEKLLDNMELAL